MKQLFNREDARRMARTLAEIRNEQGESIPTSSIRRMQAMPANVLACFAARPASFRTVKLASATPQCVTFRFSCDEGR